MIIVEALRTFSDYAGDILQIITFAAFLIKPAREWLLGIDAIREGQRCLLRADIVGIYYKNKDKKQLREYEFQHLEHCYKAYKALGGNSFIDHIYAEMQDWEII